MLKSTDILVCLLIMALDIAAGVLGIEAEIAQNKVRHLKLWIFECRDPSLKAFHLGLAAAVLLVLANVIANLFGGCICFRSKDELEKASINKQLAFGSLTFSWIMLAIGFMMLIMGALANSKSSKSCGIVVHHHLLSIGGIVCFFHGLFSIFYYIFASATAREENQQIQQRDRA